MRETTTPPTARTDVAATPPTAAPTPGRARAAGALLAGGAVLWAGSMFVFGPQADGVGGRVGDLTGLVFQLGLFGLLGVMLRTGATGTRRLARGTIRVEYVLLTLASLWSLLHGLLPDGARDAGWLAVLDVFWPLSMLGMFVIGIKVAVAGRWRGALRAWPAVAESWAVVTVPAIGALGPEVGAVVGGAHLLVGYTVLGLLLALRPELTGRP